MSTISSVNSTVSIFLLDNIVPRGEILQKYNVEKTREEKDFNQYYLFETLFGCSTKFSGLTKNKCMIKVKRISFRS